MPIKKLRRLRLRPQWVWPTVIVGIFIAELVLAYFVYQSYDVATALIAICGVPVLAAIDYFARLGAGTAQPTWYRRYLAWWCLVPFVSALAGSIWVHYQKRQESLEDIRQVAADIRQAVLTDFPEKSWGEPKTTVRSSAIVWRDCRSDAADDLTTEDVNRAVARLVAQRFATDVRSLADPRVEPAPPSEEAKRFGEVARVAGYDLRLACGNYDLVYSRIKSDTYLGFVLAIAIQALFVLWIPVLLAVAIARAHKRGSHKGPRGVCESLHGRDSQILAEDRFLFVPRFCFGALLVLGTNYVFAPFGLKATSILAVVTEHALPGHTSWTLWSTSFAEAPVIVVGFVGFLLYALITATQRFALEDLDDQAVLSLLVRGLVVILLSFALSASPMNDTVSRVFVFVAGVFPLRALESLAKKANIAIDPDFEGAVSSFDGLPSLDPVKVFALRSAGIQSTYDLAATPIEEIAERVRIDPRLLGRAVDRAVLIDAIGPELAKRLEPFAITSATELVALKDRMPDLVEEPLPDGSARPGSLREAALRVAERLANDLRVAQVRTWLAGTPYFDGLNLEPGIELALRASGIQSAEELVAIPIAEVARRTHLDPCALGRVVDTALLVVAVGYSAARQLEHLGIETATDLVERQADHAAALVTILGDTLAPVIERLSKDHRVADVRQWLLCAIPPPGSAPPAPRR